MKKRCSNKFNEKKLKLKKKVKRKSDRNYQIIRKLGNGCFGFVFEAIDINKNKVAWKRMHKNSNNKSRELHILELLKDSKHCIKLQDFFYTKNNSKQLIQNFILEICDDNLESVLSMKNKNIFDSSFINTKKIIYQILLGLKEMHDLSICHRDLKPENIFFKGNVIKIGDFGSSKQLMNFEENTPYVVSRYYRAPELILGIKCYSLNIDLFSVGVIFYELITGKLPFKGNSEGQQLIEIFKNLGPPCHKIKHVYRVLTGWHHKFKTLKSREKIPINLKEKEPSFNDIDLLFNYEIDKSQKEIIFKKEELSTPPYKELYLQCEEETLKKRVKSPIWDNDFEMLLKIRGNFKYEELLKNNLTMISEYEFNLLKE